MMRRLFAAIAALSLVQGASANMNDWFCGDAWVAGEALLLRPSGYYPYVAFIGRYNPPVIDTGFPKGRQVQAGMSYGWGYKVELGYSACNQELLVNWSSLNHSDRVLVRGRPDELVTPVQVHPFTQDLFSFVGGSANVKLGMKYDALDGEAAHWMCRDCSRWAARLFAGVRYARIVSAQEMRFFSSDGVFEQLTRQSSDVQGTGPRVGIGGEMDLCWGFSVDGSLSGSLLLGSAKSRYREEDITPEFFDESVSMANDAVFRLIPAADLKFGLSFCREYFCGITSLASVGYQLAYYSIGASNTDFSGVDREFVSVTNFSEVGNRVLDRPISFNGWYFRLGFMY